MPIQIIHSCLKCLSSLAAFTLCNSFILRKKKQLKWMVLIKKNPALHTVVSIIIYENNTFASNFDKLSGS